MKETTYNKYKRQNKIMSDMLNKDVLNFIVNEKDWKERRNYLYKCIALYRINKSKKSNIGRRIAYIIESILGFITGGNK